MARIEKTVFISYRRADRWQALAVYKDLTHHGYDVFIDYEGISAGDFEQAIIENIRARAHFVLLLTPQALARCDTPEDWLRREIEAAIVARRNVVPLLLDGFQLDSELARRRLQGSLAPLGKYQALPVPDDYFDAAMDKLRSKRLALAVDAVIHPASAHAQAVAARQQAAAEAESEPGDTNPAPARTPAAIDNPPAHPVRPAPQAPPAKGKGLKVGGVLLSATVLAWMASGRREEPPIAQVAETPVAMAASVGSQTDELALPPTAAGAGPQASDKANTASPSDLAAYVKLGDNYLYGRNGQPQDDALAVHWYRMAAEQGNGAGQVNLAYMYRKGRGGLPQNDAEAVMWLRAAVGQGDADGQANLGVMYEQGRGGLSKSDEDAAKWFQKAAEQGNEHGQAYLGDFYERGAGNLPEDMEQALKYYRLAAAKGNNYAKNALKRLGTN